jgi:hypothetical protein
VAGKSFLNVSLGLLTVPRFFGCSERWPFRAVFTIQRLTDSAREAHGASIATATLRTRLPKSFDRQRFEVAPKSHERIVELRLRANLIKGYGHYDPAVRVSSSPASAVK